MNINDGSVSWTQKSYLLTNSKLESDRSSYMVMIVVMQYGLAILMFILLGYQLVKGGWALTRINKIFSHAGTKRNFAIVICSNSHHQVISQSLYSLFGLVYPKSKYDVIISSDCLTEYAAREAKKMGAIILNAESSLETRKGLRLQRVFKQVMNINENYDAIVVIEPESLVSGNYLDVLNYYLDHGSRVIQSSNLILPDNNSEEYEERRINFFLNNLLYPRGQKVLDLSTNFRGSNFCFSTDLLRDKMGSFPSYNVDNEYGIQLHLNGIEIDFAPEAVVWKQQSINGGKESTNLNIKQSKWFSLVRCYLPALIKAAGRYKSFSYYRKVFGLVKPSIVNMLFIALSMMLLNLIGGVLTGPPLVFLWIWCFICALVAINIFVEGYTMDTYFRAYKSII